MVVEEWSGRDLPDAWLFVFLVVAVAAVRWRQFARLPSVFVRPGIAEWFPFLGWAALSLLWTDALDYGAVKLASFVALGVVPAALIVFLGRPRPSAGWWLVLVGGLLFDATVIFFGQAAESRLTFKGGNPIWIARSCYMTASIALWAGGVPWTLRGLALVGSVFVALGTGSRGPLLAAVAAPLVAAILKRRRKSDRQKPVRRWKTWLALAAMAGSAAVAVAASSIGSTGDGAGVDRILTLFDSGHSLAEDAAVAERIYLQRTAWDRFVESPIVGAGAGGSAPVGTVAYPHNILLEVAAEFGLVGLLLWLWCVLRILWRARDQGVILVLFVQVTIYAMSSGDLSSNELIAVLSGMVGVGSAVGASGEQARRLEAGGALAATG